MKTTKKLFPVLFACITLITGLITSCSNDDDQKPDDQKSKVDKKVLVEIPDPKFTAYLKQIIPKAFPNGGDKLDSEDTKVKSRKFLFIKNKEIKSLVGIEYFTKLEELYCSGNLLDTLDLAQNTALTSLNCSENKLTSLRVAKNTKLKVLYCYDNQLKTLDLRQNTKLERLYCYKNQLKTLDLSQNTELELLDCYGNQLMSLDLSHNCKLKNKVVNPQQGEKEAKVTLCTKKQ